MTDKENDNETKFSSEIHGEVDDDQFSSNIDALSSAKIEDLIPTSSSSAALNVIGDTEDDNQSSHSLTDGGGGTVDCSVENDDALDEG